MNAVGIVAEYDPFHLGHSYHIAQTRRLLGENVPVVCVMSGGWRQRGECALTDKWTRAELALRGGADLVLELPLPWAVSSAEGFAQGAVELLKSAGVVDTLSFGSESGDGEALKALASTLESAEYRKALRTELDKGVSFAAAREKAAEKCVGKTAHLLRGANDSLGVEYLRAAGDELGYVTVKRKGVSHDSVCPADGFASATLIRRLIRAGEWAAAEEWLPEGSVKRLQTAGITDMKNVERAFLARLRSMREEDFAALPDSGAAEGLPARLVKAAGKAEDLEAFYAQAKTKRYAHARIRRLALWAFLGLTAADRGDRPEYLRVLGMNGRGKVLLREMKKKASLPVLTKPAHIRELGEAAQALFAMECQGTDLFGLCFDKAKPCGMDYTTGPAII